MGNNQKKTASFWWISMRLNSFMDEAKENTKKSWNPYLKSITMQLDQRKGVAQETPLSSSSIIRWGQLSGGK